MNCPRLSYAIPMPYLPSNPDTTEKPRSSSPTPTEPGLEMNLSAPEQCTLAETGEEWCPPSPTRVHSKAVVRYAEVGIPAPLNRIAENTDLR